MASTNYNTMALLKQSQLFLFKVIARSSESPRHPPGVFVFFSLPRFVAVSRVWRGFAHFGAVSRILARFRAFWRGFAHFGAVSHVFARFRTFSRGFVRFRAVRITGEIYNDSYWGFGR